MGKKNSVWTDEEKVREAFGHANSMKDVLSYLGEPTGSANYSALKLYAKKYNLVIPVYVNDGLTLRSFKGEIPLEKILVENSTYQSRQALKRKLIKELGWIDKCGVLDCPSPKPMWAGKPLVLQLEHINGVGNDNRIENLMFICPNCHTQTSTFGNRNPNRVSKRYFCECGNSKRKYSERCNSCAAKESGRVQFVWPPLQDVVRLVRTTNFVQAARVLGCSDKAIRKLFIRNQIPIKITS